MNIDFFINYLENISYVGIFIILALVGYLIPIPEEIMLIVVGYISALGFYNVYIALIVSIIALLVGDSLLFWLSKGGSKYIIKIMQKYKEENIQKYDQLMKNDAGKTIFFLRFIIGVRMFGPLLAGSLKIRWTTFLIYDTLALFFYASLLIFLGFHFHNQLALIISDMAVIRHIIFLIIVIGLGFGIALHARNRFFKADDNIRDVSK